MQQSQYIIKYLHTAEQILTNFVDERLSILSYEFAHVLCAWHVHPFCICVKILCVSQCCTKKGCFRPPMFPDIFFSDQFSSVLAVNSAVGSGSCKTNTLCRVMLEYHKITWCRLSTLNFKAFPTTLSVSVNEWNECFYDLNSNVCKVKIVFFMYSVQGLSFFLWTWFIKVNCWW